MKLIAATGLLAIASFVLAGCGTSSEGPGGSKEQTMSGVNENGYPGGKPSNAHSPALGSSSEQLNSREQAEEREHAEAGHKAEK